MTRKDADGRNGGQIRNLLRAGTVGRLSDGELTERFRSGDDASSGPAFEALMSGMGRWS